MSYDAVVAFDPGLSGGISIFKNNKLEYTGKIPILKIAKKKSYNLEEIKSTICNLSNCIVLVEKQSSRPGEGSVSSFTNGTGYGSLKALGIGLGYEVRTILPKKWKESFIELENNEVISAREALNTLKSLQKKELEDNKSSSIKCKNIKTKYKKDIDRAFREIKKHSKNASLSLARQRFPEFNDKLLRANCDGVAESILIGLFAVNNIKDIQKLTNNYYS